MTTESVIDEIEVERKRQIEVEGYRGDHDDRHEPGTLAQAAAAYASASVGDADAGLLWPWHPDEFKPKDPRRDLIRAAALLIAEIERLDRTA